MIYGVFEFNNFRPEPYLNLTNIGSHLLGDNSICNKIIKEGEFSAFVLKNHVPQNKESSLFFNDIENGVFVIMDGYVYNHLEIGLKLNYNEVPFFSPQLAIKAFLKWGPSFGKHLNGDFSICIYLTKEKKAYFIRDQVGIRPLVLYFQDSNVFFATDPIGLCKALDNVEKIDYKFLMNFFMWSGFHYGLLPNQKVYTVKPGHYVEITTKGSVEKKYWFPEKIKKDNNLTFKKATKDLSNLLSDAVRIRSDQRFTAAAHVSGGLDSGILAALARREYKNQEKFFGFSWTTQTQEKAQIAFDERELVKKLCDQNDIIPIFPDYNLDDYLSFVSDWRHPSEQLYERRVVELAKARKVNLIFSGWGGDEFISIGNRGIDADLMREGSWSAFIKKHPFWRPKKFLSALFNAIFPGARRGYSKIKADPSVYPYIKKALGSNRISRNERFKYHSRRLVHLQLLEMGHLAKRASDWYVHGQRNGLEYRFPLLDKRIIEYMLKVPSRCLVGGNHNRILLREIGKDQLPKDILENKSKDDPIKSQFYNKTVEGVKNQFIEEFKTFKQNPDLGFVDFDLLEKNLPEIRAGKMDASIFYYLKAAHEFTKGYYGKD